MLLLFALPGSHGTTIYQQHRIQQATTNVNALRVLRRHGQLSLLIAKQIGIKAGQQADDWSG